MPKLIILAPCDNVLLGSNNDIVSLIVIMTTVSFPKPPEEAPVGAVGPLRWFVFCNWLVHPSEFGKTFEQRIKFGDGSLQLLEAIQDMPLEDGKMHHRMVAALNLFPLVNPGIYQIDVHYREKGTTDWLEGGFYPLLVQHTEPAQ